VLFAVGLLFAGVASSVTAALAGGTTFTGYLGKETRVESSWFRLGALLTLIPAYGVRTTFMILGVIFLFMTVIGAFLLQNPPVGYRPAGWTPAPASKSAATTYEFSPGEVLRTPAFYFMWIAYAMNRVGEQHDQMWDETDGFFYDVLRLPDGSAMRLKVRSMVGLLPLCASTILEPETVTKHPRLMELIAFDEQDWALIEKRWDARRFTQRDGSEGISALVFHRNGKPVVNATFGRQWRTAAERAGLGGKLFHDLRRTAARDMLRAGVPQAYAMRVTGHETDSMFRRYAIEAPEDFRETLRKRREYVESQASNVRRIRN
jgi:hypothetical protein